MKKGKTELEKMQDKVQKMVVRVNEKITILGEHLGILNTTLTNIQEEFDKVQNIPNEEKIRYEELKQIRLNWKNQVDEIIKKSIKQYNINRLNKVDLCIIRYATYEMKYLMTPFKIAINEAIIITKILSDTGDGKQYQFTNKLLDQIKDNLGDNNE